MVTTTTNNDGTTMHLTLIRPNIGNYKAKDALEPIVFAILKAISPKDWQMKLYDDRIETVSFDHQTDLVVITVETFTALRAYAIAKKFRDRGVKVIMGGFHPTLLPDEVEEHCDSLLIGDAEGVWPEVIKDIESGNLKKRYSAPDEYSIKGIIPDRTIFDSKKYGPVHLVQYTRGCRYNCSFCSINAFYQNKLIARDVSDVVEEIKTLYRPAIFFADDNLFSDRKSVVKLLTAITPLKKKWMGQISIDIAKDEELLKLMKKSGCFALLIGLESLQEENLKALNKGWGHKQVEYEEAIKRIKKKGIMVHGTFIVGNDGDNPVNSKELVKFSLKNKLFLAHFNPLLPTPSTKLYSDFEREGKLLYKAWWLDPNYSYGMPVFSPKNFTQKEFEDTVFDLRIKFNSYFNIFRRMLDRSVLSSPFNIVIFLLANFVTRREIINKQRIKIGS